jgi:hypothetical protein
VRARGCWRFRCPTVGPTGTEFRFSFPFCSYHIRNFDKLIALLATCFHADFFLSIFFYPEDGDHICSSETSVDFQRTTLCYIPEDGTLLASTYPPITCSHKQLFVLEHVTMSHLSLTEARTFFPPCPDLFGSPPPSLLSSGLYSRGQGDWGNKQTLSYEYMKLYFYSPYVVMARCLIKHTDNIKVNEAGYVLFCVRNLTGDLSKYCHALVTRHRVGLLYE